MIDLRIASPFYGIDFAQKYWRKCGIDRPARSRLHWPGNCLLLRFHQSSQPVCMMISMRSGLGRTTAAVLVLTAGAVAACTTAPQLTAAPSEPPQPAPAPLPPQRPPIDLAGRWRLAAASGACLMTFAPTPGGADGTIAPAGGCPGNFFTSRKWTFEHDMLIIRDHKNEALAELSFAAGRFQGQAAGGGSITLARP